MKMNVVGGKWAWNIIKQAHQTNKINAKKPLIEQSYRGVNFDLVLGQNLQGVAGFPVVDAAAEFEMEEEKEKSKFDQVEPEGQRVALTTK